MQKKFNTVILLLILFLISPVKAQSAKIELTGNLHTDSKVLFDRYEYQTLPEISFQVEDKKSPFLAGLMSLVVPGAGEVYAGEYWKAAAFIVLEAAVITTAVIYDGKGDDQTEKFENYADENWSVVDYAEWLGDYKEADIDKIIILGTEGLPPWQRVNWAELNAAERHAATLGVGFTHTLPPYGDQQYYELIGKYHDYSPGWNDFSGDGNTNLLSPNFKFYSKERGKANDFYSVAKTAVIGIYLNHFLSALDAAWSTISYNKSLAVKMRVEQIQLANQVELIPTLKVSFSF
ncbi:MAG: hypothetical protein EHM47_11630 [Ignavibacteriales bacterium]|nr:MAG: hypothetical protein EHM47_11630 [Ignavibacteriales bacterium]